MCAPETNNPEGIASPIRGGGICAANDERVEIKKRADNIRPYDIKQKDASAVADTSFMVRCKGLEPLAY